MRKIIASLDIGSSKIKLVVGEYLKNSLNILCVVETVTHGLKKGLIINNEALITTLKETFHKAEEMLGLPIKEVVLSLPAYNTEVITSEGATTITSEDHFINYQDLIKAMEASSYGKISKTQELITIIPIQYKINEDEIVKNPINLNADKLTTKVALVTIPKANAVEFLNILDNIGVKVIDFTTTSLSDYAANRNDTLSSSFGAIVNIGEETTTVSIFNKGILTKAEVIELGGANVDNDIAYVYKVTKKDAKELKENLGLASHDLAQAEEKAELTDRLGEKIIINQVDLSEIIESRLEEILNLVKKQINLLTKKDIQYILLTGGTTEIRDFNILLDKVFTKSTILGKIDSVGVRSNKFSTSVGTIKYYNNRLKLQNKEYCLFDSDELEILSGNHKKVNINENSILGKVFGYFFDN